MNKIDIIEIAMIINKLIDTKSTQYRHYYTKNDTY